jgi:hypothetical protein
MKKFITIVFITITVAIILVFNIPPQRPEVLPRDIVTNFEAYEHYLMAAVEILFNHPPHPSNWQQPYGMERDEFIYQRSLLVDEWNARFIEEELQMLEEIRSVVGNASIIRSNNDVVSFIWLTGNWSSIGIYYFPNSFDEVIDHLGFDDRVLGFVTGWQLQQFHYNWAFYIFTDERDTRVVPFYRPSEEQRARFHP